jgi:hypothetical protein
MNMLEAIMVRDALSFLLGIGTDRPVDRRAGQAACLYLSRKSFAVLRATGPSPIDVTCAFDSLYPEAKPCSDSSPDPTAPSRPSTPRTSPSRRSGRS